VFFLFVNQYITDMKKLIFILFATILQTAWAQPADFTYSVNNLTVSFTNNSSLPNGNPDSLYYEWEINGPGSFTNSTNRLSTNPEYTFVTVRNQYTATLRIQQAIRFGSTSDSVIINTVASKAEIINMGTNANRTISGNVTLNSNNITNGIIFLLKQTGNTLFEIKNANLTNGTFSFTELNNDTFLLWAINFDTTTNDLKAALPTYSGNQTDFSQAVPLIVNGQDITGYSLALQSSTGSNGALRISTTFKTEPQNDISLLLYSNESNSFVGHVRFNKIRNNTLEFNNIATGNYTIFPIMNGIPYPQQRFQVNADTAIELDLNTTTGLRSTINQTIDVDVFPNPSKNKLHVHVTDAKILSVTLYTLNGQSKVMELSNNSSIDLSEEKSGMYLLQIVTDKGTITRSVIKE
jgi:hypothetical protein